MAIKPSISFSRFVLEVESSYTIYQGGEDVPDHWFEDDEIAHPKMRLECSFTCRSDEPNPETGRNELRMGLVAVSASAKFADSGFVEEWKNVFIRRLHTFWMHQALLQSASDITHQAFLVSLESCGVPLSEAEKTRIVRWQAKDVKYQVKKRFDMPEGRGRPHKLPEMERAALVPRYNELCRAFAPVETAYRTNFDLYYRSNPNHSEVEWKRWWAEHGSAMFTDLPRKLVARFDDPDAPTTNEVALEQLAAESGYAKSTLRRYVLPEERARIR